MKIIKRDGRIVDYDRQKISIAIEKANRDVNGKEKATKEEMEQYIEIVDEITAKLEVIDSLNENE